MTSLTKAIFINIDNNTGEGDGNVYVPFPVKEIIVRQIAYNDDQNLSGLKSFGVLFSDLFSGQTLGFVNIGSTAGTAHMIANNGFIKREFNPPLTVNGMYRFNIRDLNNDPFPFGGVGTYKICVILEFVEYR